MESKRCSRCKEVKPIEAFARQRTKSNPEGRQGECRQCRSERNAAYRASEQVQESARLRARNFYEGNREKVKERGRAIYQANKERARGYGRNWYQRSGKVTKRRYRVANRMKDRGYNALRRARLKAATLGPVDMAAIIERDSSTCYLCGQVLAPDKITIDHVIPLVRGGSHTADNLRVACRPCNSRKNGRLLSECEWYSA